MRRRSAALLSIAFFAAPGWPEDLFSGQSRQRGISAAEPHVYHLEVSGEPVLVLVEQQGIDLVVEASKPDGQEKLKVDSPNSRWGPEVLVLAAGSPDRYQVEIRPGPGSAPGRYTIRVEELSNGTETDARRASALAAMSRAGQLVPGPPETQGEVLALYREALAAWRALGERRWEAETLLDIAAREQQTGDLRAAVADGRQALALWRDLAEPRRVAAALSVLGLAFLGSGEIDSARSAMDEALALWRSLGESSEEEETRKQLCLLEQTGGSLPSALACYRDLLALYQGRGNSAGEAAVLNNLGGVYDLLGEPDAALENYRKALAVWQALGDRTEEAKTLNNLAVIHRALGEWQEALRIYGQTREILAATARRSSQATLLNNVGFTYLTLGEPDRALAFLEDALRMRREMGERPNEVITLNNLGLTWRHLGETGKALDHHRQALKLAEALGEGRQQAMSRLRLGEAYLESGDAADPVAALRELEPALAFFRDTGMRGREAQALQVQGRALALAGRPGDALPRLREVLERSRALRDRAGEAEVLHALARVERTLGLLDEARGHAEQAVARVEELRSGFVSPDLRAAFLATRRRAYELRIDLLMDRHFADLRGGHDRLAFEVSEQARARTLLDALRSGRTGSAAPAALLERRESLRRRMSAKADQQLKQTGARAEALGREIETLMAELDGVEAEIRRQDPEYAAFSQPRPIGVDEVSALLDPGTLLLEYSLGEERSFLWAVGSGPGSARLRSFVLPPRKEIEGLVRQAYEELSTVGSGITRQREVIETLSGMLLGPVRDEVEGIQRLIVVPDGALHILPFAALRAPGDGQDLLLKHHEVVYIPSGTTLALQRQRLERRTPAPKWAAVLADPVFSPDDERFGAPVRPGQVAGPLPAFARLSSSRREAEEISALAPSEVRSELDFAASRETLLSGKLDDYRVVHFATHGVADTRNQELSGLVLSLVDKAGRPQEGFLGVNDIYELNLSADLVVLSGCRTALGKEVRGEGLMGLTRGFLHAGVPRVVGSLWPVQDRATAELMSRFYKAMWQGRLSPAAALREAQLSLSRERRYLDPYSWAGFVLQGDWR